MIKNVADWRGRDHRMMFAEAWGFDYLAGCDTVGMGIRSDKGDYKSYLERHHGIIVVEQRFGSEEEAYDIVRRELGEGRPVLLSVDPYECEWDFINYRKNHSHHYLCVTGIDLAGRMFHCFDLQMAKHGLALPSRRMRDMCTSMVLFRFENCCEPIDMASVAAASCRRLLDADGKPKLGNAIRGLAQAIGSIRFEREFPDAAPQKALIFVRTVRLGSNRLKFSETLACMRDANKAATLDNLIEDVRDLGARWALIGALVMKSYYLGDRNGIVSTIVGKLCEIADREDSLIERIAGMTSKGNGGCEHGNHTSPSERKVASQDLGEATLLPLDLRPYKNCNGLFGEISDRCSCELSNPRRYLCVDRAASVQVINALELPLCNAHEDAFDNVSCDGQAIEVGIEDPIGIAFVSCAEFGSFREHIRLEFDGRSVTISAGFTSWLSPCPEFGERIALAGRGVVVKDGRASAYPFPAHIFSTVCPVDASGFLRRIVLPKCRNIHVFALGVLRSK
jgi:hypothetical protein